MQFRFPLSRCERHASIDPYACDPYRFSAYQSGLYPLLVAAARNLSSLRFRFSFSSPLFSCFSSTNLSRERRDCSESRNLLANNDGTSVSSVSSRAFKNGAIGMTFREIAMPLYGGSSARCSRISIWLIEVSYSALVG